LSYGQTIRLGLTSFCGAAETTLGIGVLRT